MSGSKIGDAEKQVEVCQFELGQSAGATDSVAVEEPLEIRVVFGPANRRRSRSLCVTMRTPGNDRELAAGFLFGEGIISATEQIADFKECAGPNKQPSNLLEVHLREEVQFEFERFQRHFYTTSSCGVCGKASLKALHHAGINRCESGLKVAASTLLGLPESLKARQKLFALTGGIHAAGIATRLGRVTDVCEDVGRHNALDKLIGKLLLSRQSGADRERGSIVSVSGRASFELLQKTAVASIPIFVAVGAPSSLAVELACEFNITLVGFAKAHRFNVYSCPERIAFD